ncbi:hypothetical protein QO010_002824 [Caulobacter ginsengisoli]|uniref:Uncharacterized protein n=1 Tax=Caulobacter ginsengisoli TaxID=400775 RepID=A0ABU0ISR6_9CAUL|nr:DUF6491 family protein [Caulobacter ginsengisoli]MDQ0465040.1 hypothetical protein [Caulobacter ginsengisoli]
MTKTLFITLAVTALAGTAGLGAAGASPAAAKPTRSCFFVDQVNSWRQAGDESVLVKVGANQIYRLDLFGPCHDLDTNFTIGLEARGGGSSICDGLDATIIAHSPIGPMRCPVTKVTRLTPEEIAALPKRDIP